MRARAIVWCLVVVLLGTIVALDVSSMRHLSLTYDEEQHLLYGQNILDHDSRRFDDSKMPMSVLNALPSAIVNRLRPGALTTTQSKIEAGRYVTVFFTLLVALCVFTWTHELYGAKAGLLALTLYTFDPNLLAHSQLVTTDLYATGTITFALYAFWRYLRRGTWSAATIAGVALGLAQIAKYTAVALFPLFALTALLFHAREISRELSERRVGALKNRLTHFVGWSLLFIVLALAVINAGFLFNRTGSPLRSYTFRSDTFRAIQKSAGLLNRVPLPLPHPYLEGLDWVVQRERTGEGYGNLYLFGEIRHGAGFAGYYLYAALYKVPLGTQLVVLVALLTLAARLRRSDDLKNEWVILVPIAFYVVYFNFFYRAQIGIRFFLVVFPLLYVLAGSLLKNERTLSRRATVGLTAAIAGLVISVLSSYPHFLPYVNELIGDKRLAYKKLADSNIDWGQQSWYVEQYLASHPGVIVEPDSPTTGTILVGVNALTGVTGEPETFKWLRDNFLPVDDIAHAVLIYRVTPSDLERLRE